MVAARLDGAVDLPNEPLCLATSGDSGDRTTERDKIAADGRLPLKDRFGVNEARLGRTPAGPNAAGPPRAVAND